MLFRSWALSGQVQGWPRLAATLGAPSPELRSLERAEGIWPEPPLGLWSVPPSPPIQLPRVPCALGWEGEVMLLAPGRALQGVPGPGGHHRPSPAPSPSGSASRLCYISHEARLSCDSSPPHCRPLGASRAPWASGRDGAPRPPRPPRPSRQPRPPSKRPPRRPLLPAAADRQGQ